MPRPAQIDKVNECPPIGVHIQTLATPGMARVRREHRFMFVSNVSFLRD
jgi:hypothetical protein